MQDKSFGTWRFSTTSDTLLDLLLKLQSESIIFPHEFDYLSSKINAYLSSEFQEPSFLIEGVNKNIILLKSTGDDFDVIINRTEEALDPVSLLPTRIALFRQIDKWISQNADNAIIGLFIIELDEFSQINDALDHATGDLLLFQIARRIEKYDHHKFKLVRLHGDEFGFAVNNLATVEACWEVTNWLFSCFEQPFETPKEGIYLKPSMGFSVIPHVASDQQTLLQTAYVALNKAKLDTSEQVHFYDNSHAEELQRNLHIESELNDALRKEGELVSFYQPKLTLATNQITGVEALIRWHHPKNGLMSPGLFIPIAERTGLICNITNFIIEQVCKDLPTLRKSGFTGPVSINISARDFARTSFVSDVMSILSRHHVSPSDIELEITEGAFISDFGHCCAILNALRENNFQLSIDDFGTGYSSLSYLSKLPVDILKIDMSFVRNIENSEKIFKTFGALMQIADALNLKVVAEGVDNKKQKAKLIELDCDMIQGYLLTKPLSLKQFSGYLKNFES